MANLTKRTALLVALVLGGGCVLQAAVPGGQGPKPKPRIELAILLDTSSSMSGLINQARTQLWKIINEFEGVRRDGERPLVFVALYEYGNSNLAQNDGYMRMILPLTTDLDRVSEELFALSTRGGSEHCGQVIDLAVRELAWSQVGKDLKCIFIAGNEPFTQGPIDLREACHAAASKNITIPTIHCGDHQTGINTMWAEGAKLADGDYLSINHNRAIPHIAAPQDAKLVELSSELNTTYIPYGNIEARRRAAARQTAQDGLAAGASPSAGASRGGFKASANYRNAHWDLVDAIRERKAKLNELEEEDLPETMQEMSLQERQEYVEKMAKRRKEIQQKIKQLNAERKIFVAKEREKQTTKNGEQTLDTAILAAVRNVAKKRGYSLGE